MDIKLSWAERLLGKWFHKYSLLGDKPFYNPHVFEVAKELEDNYPKIREEVEAILKRYDDLVVFQDVSPNQAYIPIDDKWRMFFFKVMGMSFKAHADIAPVTASIIAKHKDICSAYISVLGPKTYLNPHRGPWSGILRLHMGAVVPGTRNCVLVVEGTSYFWREGETVLFDDTFEHMAFNTSDKPRAIVFLDIMRPLPQPLKALNWLCMYLSWLTPYIMGGYFRHRAWQKKFFGANDAGVNSTT